MLKSPRFPNPQAVQAGLAAWRAAGFSSEAVDIHPDDSLRLQFTEYFEKDPDLDIKRGRAGAYNKAIKAVLQIADRELGWPPIIYTRYSESRGQYGLVIPVGERFTAEETQIYAEAKPKVERDATLDRDEAKVYDRMKETRAQAEALAEKLKGIDAKAKGLGTSDGSSSVVVEVALNEKLLSLVPGEHVERVMKPERKHEGGIPPRQ